MNRILIKKDELEGNIVVIKDYRKEHILNVLSPSIGDTLKIGILNGAYGQGVVRNISSKAIRLECLWSEKKEIPDTTTSLLLALPRPKVLKRLLPQIVSMGVENIILTNASKVEKNYFATHWLDEKHYSKLIINGLEQSGDTKVPNIQIVKRLKPFIEDELPILFPSHNRIIAHPYTTTTLKDIQLKNDKTLVAIGPEGGWDSYELEIFNSSLFNGFNMGARIIRSDTATIAILATLNN